MLLPLVCLAQEEGERPVFIPKGNYSAGAQLASLNFDSDNSDYMLLLNPINAKARITTIAPFVEYGYAPDQTAGVRLAYTYGNAVVDKVTVDLLNDGMQYDFTDVDTEMTTLGAVLYHRTYYGIDRKRRLGLILEESLTLTKGKTDFSSENSGVTKSNSFKVKAAFSPGMTFFVLNNVSIMCTISIANVNYTKVACYEEGERIGDRQKFAARVGLDILGLWFGTAYHF